jgi:hypothetical protein
VSTTGTGITRTIKSSYRYLINDFYIEMAKRRGLTAQWVLAETRRRHASAKKAGFDWHQIFTWRLDNPFMDKTARQVLINEAMRYRKDSIARGHAAQKKRMQSAQARKLAA